MDVPPSQHEGGQLSKSDTYACGLSRSCTRLTYACTEPCPSPGEGIPQRPPPNLGDLFRLLQEGVQRLVMVRQPGADEPDHEFVQGRGYLGVGLFKLRERVE